MPPRTLDADEDLNEVEGELRHTYIHCNASPLTAALAAPFAQLREENRGVIASEIQHQEALEQENARALFIDDEMNGLVDETKVAALAEVKNDYQAPLYKRLFGGESPSEVKKPTLGAQLTTMRAWIAPLSAHANTTLSNIGERLAQEVIRADAVVSGQALAQQQLDQFTLGPRKVFIEKCNAARKLTYGKLSELVHASGDQKLAAGFADRFFLVGSSSRAPTITEVENGIGRLKTKLARQEALLQDLKDKQDKAQRTRHEAELADRQARLAAAEKKAAEAAQELAALKGETDED